MNAPFVGRDHDLTVLADAFARAEEGSSAALLIGGEAGAGKSRLVAEFTGTLAGRALVLHGGCVELGANGLAFAPFTAVLRSLVRGLGAAEVSGLLPHGEARELGRLLPALGPAADDRPGTAARARLFEEFLTLFAALAERRPVVLVIEDAHWADGSSRELLGFLVRNQHTVPGLLVIAVHRTDQLHRSHPLRGLLAELDRLAWVTRFELDRLARNDVLAMLDGLLGRRPDAPLAEKVLRRSAGNPLFVEVLSAGADAPVPDSIRDLLAAPLERLPDPTVRAVRAAAAGGMRVDHALLCAVTGLDDAELTDALRPAVHSNLVLTVENAYTFRHALVQEVVYEDTLPGDRTLLHLRYAEAIENDPFLVPDGRAAVEAAHHWYASRRRPAEALAASWRAAAQARAALAYAEQLHMLRRVLELWEQVPDAEQRIARQRAQVVDEAIRAGMSVGEATRTMELIDATLAENADAARAGRLLSYRGELRHVLGRPGDLDDLREAAALMPPGDDARASVLNTLTNRLLAIPRDEEARAVAQEAFEAAQQGTERGPQLTAAVNLAYARGRTGDIDGQLPHITAARTDAGDDHDTLMRALRCEADLLQTFGRYEQAAAAARQGLRAATEAGLARTSGPVHAGNLAEALIALGHWDEAAETLDHALDHAPNPSLRAYLLVLQGTIALPRGDLALARTCADYAREIFTSGTRHAQDYLLLIHLEAELHLAQDRLPEAASLVEQALETSETGASTRYLWPLIEAGARAGLNAAQPPAIGPVQNALRLAVTAQTRKPGLWESVARAWKDLHQPHPEALALLQAAETAIESGARETAAAHLHRAAALADHLSARPLRAQIDRLAKLARISPDATPRTDKNDFGLTPRERQVLDLLAAGRTNRQIAEQLFISTKTAGAHVSNILAKLGVPTRLQAATAAHRHHLIRTDESR